MHFVIIGYSFPDIGQACKPHFNLSILPADVIYFLSLQCVCFCL